MSFCNRCGKCCEKVGRNFWRFSNHPLVKAMQKRVPPDNNECEPCDMLRYPGILGGRKAVCLLELYFGKAAKPDACRKYFCDQQEDFLTPAIKKLEKEGVPESRTV